MMKNIVNELFEVHKNKTFDQFLADELNYHLVQVETNWVGLLNTEKTNWEEYWDLLENIAYSLNTSIDFIERTEGPEVISILYEAILNHVEDKMLNKTRISAEDYSEIHYILASLGTCMNPEVLELGLVKEGEINNHLNDQILTVLENFGK